MAKKIKIGLIGGGKNSSIGPSHILALNSNNQWSIECGVLSKNKKYLNKNFNNSKIRIYNNIKSLITNEKNKLDAILLLTPPNQNKKIVQEILRLNIPIISEKPVFDSPNGLEKIRKKIINKKIPFYVTYNYSGYPAIKELKALIKNQQHKLKKINIEMPQQGLFIKNNLIKKWRKFDKNIPNLFLDLGSHIFNLVYYLTDKYPEKLICISNKKNKTIVDANIWCKFKNNFQGSFWISKFAGGHENDLKIEILLENKSYLWKHSNPDKIIFSNNKGEKKIISRSYKKLNFMNRNNYNIYKAGHPTGFVETFVNLYKDIFIDIKNKSSKNFKFNFDHVYKILKILHSMKISTKTEKWINL